MNPFLRKITSLGSSHADSKSEKRNIILSNYVSLVASTASLLLISALFFFYGFSGGMFGRLLCAACMFLVPVALNRLGFIMISRVILSWLTPLFVFGISILDLKSGELMSSASFVGLRMFLLAGCCFPFLFFDLKNKFLLAAGLSVPVLSLFFFDPIFDLFGVGYFKNGINDRFYEFSNVRAQVSAFVIGLSLFFLKRVVERGEERNHDLLEELERKNKLIQQQAEDEVHTLNKKLNQNIQQLKVSENRYRSLFEQASDFIAILDFRGNFIDANISWCNAFGYTKEELMYIKIEALIDPEQLKDQPIKYAELNRGEHVLNDRRMMRRDGTIVDVEANVKKIQEDKMLVIARDVTKLREVQRQIQISEAKFRGAFEHSAIGMALVSTEGKWLQVNRELCLIVGYSEDELLLRTVRDLTVQEEVDEGYESQQLLLRGEQETFQRERHYVHRDGSIVTVNLNVSLVRDDSGMPLYFVSQIEDITDEIKAKEKLAINEANLNATINNTQLMIWSVDRNFNLLMFNNQFSNYMWDMYGVRLQLGTRVVSPVDSEDAKGMKEKWLALYLQAFGGSRITFEEVRHGIDFQYSLSPIVEMDQVIGVSVFADNITDRRIRDQELAEANKKIGELRLMALRSVMSPHFIFNVLNSIQFFIAKNDRLNAINYLSTFSKLVRSILTHSVDNMIKLSDEVEMLQNYIQLEMTRFENKFTFSLSIDPEIDTDAIVIPSLLIQPYVENAILHGLYNKQSNGELSVRITDEDGVLFFVVEDNGIGREAAMKLRTHGHASLGINLTAERLKLINQGQDMTFEIEDLFDESGPCGTRVKIGIAYEG